MKPNIGILFTCTFLLCAFSVVFTPSAFAQSEKKKPQRSCQEYCLERCQTSTRKDYCFAQCPGQCQLHRGQKKS